MALADASLVSHYTLKCLSIGEPACYTRVRGAAHIGPASSVLGSVHSETYENGPNKSFDLSADLRWHAFIVKCLMPKHSHTSVKNVFMNCGLQSVKTYVEMPNEAIK